MAIFPSAVSIDSDLFIAKNGLGTLLSSSIDNAVTTIPVTSTTGFPTVGYIVIDSEVIKYTSTDATNFLSCTRASDGTSASSHTTGAAVKANAVADHHNALKEEIKAIEQNLSTRLGLASNNIYAQDGTLSNPSLSFWNDAASGIRYVTGQGFNLVVSATDIMALTASGASVKFAAGTVGAPSITFGDTDTGIWSATANCIRFSSNGALAFSIESTGTYHSTHLLFNSGGTYNIGDATYYPGRIFLGDGTQAAPSIAFASNPAIGFWKNSANQFSVVMNNVVYTTWSATLGTSIWGTQTSNNAAAGYIGESVSSIVGATNTPANNTFGDFTSISLTAGDWDVSLTAVGFVGASTTTYFQVGISTTSGNSATGLVDGDTRVYAGQSSAFAATALPSMSISTKRFSLASTTTIYFKIMALFSAGQPQLAGRISARRIR